MIDPDGNNSRRTHHTQVTNAQARKSSWLVAVVLLLIGTWNIYRGRMIVATVLGSIGGWLIIIGLFVPLLARKFHNAWMRFAALLGFINSRILLSVLYYLVFASYGFISRVIGRDPLNRRAARRESYWLSRKTTRQSREQFERLF